MRLRSTMAAAAVLCGSGALVSWATATATAGEMQPAETDSAYSYVGTKKCKSCHLDVHKSWAKTSMGKAFETLQPGEADQAKRKFGLDVDKDYTTDPKCLKCHTTGFGKEGGYAIPPAGNKRAARKAKNFHGVGCESCHGPGSGYVAIFEEIDESQRTYAVQELYAAGLRKIEEATCTACHNDESPTISAEDDFDYDQIMAQEKAGGSGGDLRLHAHSPLKLRAEPAGGSGP